MRKYGLSLKEAWDTSFPEVVMLSDYDELAENGGHRMDHAWLAKLKKNLGETR